MFSFNRRSFLNSAGMAGTAGLFASKYLTGKQTSNGVFTESNSSSTDTVSEVPPMPTSGWRPDLLSSSVLHSANISFVRLANNAYNGRVTADNLTSAAHNTWALQSHLHEVGFHAAALRHIAINYKALTHPHPAQLAAHFSAVQQQTGLQVPLSTYSNAIHAPASGVNSIFSTIARNGGMGKTSKAVAQTYLHYSTQSPVAMNITPGAEVPVRFGEPTAKPRIMRVQQLEQCPDCPGPGLDGNEGYYGDYYDGSDYSAYSSPSLPDNWCWYLEWFGLYITVMSLPLQAIPVAGQVITIAGITATVTGLIFNC